MNFTQLTDPYPVEVVGPWDQGPLGRGLAIAWLSPGHEIGMLWLVVFNETGEVWEVPNHCIRFPKNITYGRTKCHSN